MAMLEKIRNKAGLLVAVVGFALLAFIIGDFLRSGSTFFQQKKENILVVNGEGVHFQDFQVKVEERLNGIKMNTGRTLTDDESQQVRQDVFNSMIDDILYTEEAEKLGIVVSNEEFYDMVMGNNISPMIQQMPAFQNPQTGRFDRNILLEYLQMSESEDYDMYPEEMHAGLRQMKRDWLIAEDAILKNQLRMKFGTLISSAILANTLEAKATYEENKINVDFDYVSQPYSILPDSEVNVTDADVQKRYNETKTQYKQEEARLINYIAVNITPSQKDFENIQNKLSEVKSAFESSENVADIVQMNSDVPYVDAYSSFASLNQNLQNFVGHNPVGSVEGPVLIDGAYHLYKLEGEKTAPDSINVHLLPLPMTTDESALTALTDSLTQAIKSSSFAEVAISATGGQSNGEIGWVSERELASETDGRFKDQLFDARLNEPFIAETTMGGKFLVQVTEKTAPVKKYKVADIQVSVNPSQETKTQLYNDLSQFMAANHSVSAMKENAAEAGYNVRTDVEVTKNQINLGGIQSTRQTIQWAFNNKPGSISDIYESQNGEYFVVAALAEELPEGYRSLASVSEAIKRELINEKKAEKLVADLKAKNLTTLDQYAEAMNSSVNEVKFLSFGTVNISGIGSEPILNAKVPLAPVGEVSGPYAGKNRVYAVYVKDKKVNDHPYDEEAEKENVRARNSFRRYQFMQSSDILRENADIENNFNRFY
ncbi:MAG: SurA N-terminal domain-containing protein [Bacteroidales bacterium]|nr:SurA N-terminal domain-containing protein [Bacteroidales bacterium]